MDHVTGPRPFQGWSDVQRLTLDIACKHTKFDDFSLPEIFQGGILEYVTWPWPRPLRGQSSEG